MLNFKRKMTLVSVLFFAKILPVFACEYLEDNSTRETDVMISQGSASSSYDEQQPEEAKSFLTTLSQEIILEIAKFVRIKDGVSLASTCRYLSFLNSDELLWKQYAQRIPGYERCRQEQPELTHGKEIIQHLMLPQFMELIFPKKWAVFIPNSISGDGMTIAGYISIGNQDDQPKMLSSSLKRSWAEPQEAVELCKFAARWKQKEGFQLLELRPDFNINADDFNIGEGGFDIDESEAIAINYDGTKIAGFIQPLDLNDLVATLWTGNGYIQPLIPTSHHTSFAKSISLNGDNIAGAVKFENEHMQAFIMSKNSNLSDEVNLIFNKNESTLEAISADGKKATGYIKKDINAPHQAFIWTIDNDILFLKRLNEECRSCGLAINANGEVTVGYAFDGNHNNRKAVLWRGEDNIQSLGTLEGMTSSSARAISFDGCVVAGKSWRYIEEGTISSAYIWTEETGMLSLKKLLLDLIPSSKVLRIAKGISADGTIVFGGGKLETNRVPAWRAYIPRFDTFAREGIRLGFLEKALAQQQSEE